MLTMSKSLGSGQAKGYYTEEYTSAEGNYYSQGDTIKGQWTGQLAEEFGLQGDVDQETFDRLVDGKDPNTGEQLIKHATSFTYKNKFGKEITTSEHRAGWDLTFSAPKSISLAALVGKDERLKEAHRRAVDTAVAAVEKYVHARMGGDKQAVMTGKFIAAKFEHDTARPDKNGYAAPQLHTHVVAFNLTKLAEQWRSIDPRELYRSQRYGTAIYRAVLAEQAQKLGYEIRIDGKTGAPEIVGISAEYMKANSSRSEEIRQEAKEMKTRLEAEGHSVKEGAGLLQAAATANRRSKHFDPEEMRRRHQEVEREYGDEAGRAVAQSLQREPITHLQEDIRTRAQEAVTFARDHGMGGQAVVDRRQIVADSLRRNLGLTTYEEVETQIQARSATGDLVEILDPERPTRITTPEMLALERRNIQSMLTGKEKQEPIAAAGSINSLITDISSKQGIQLNENQRQAVSALLQSTDRTVALQGRAGTGKTTTMAVLREAAEQNGYVVRGIAPTQKARAELEKSGLRAQTLQAFVQEQRTEDDRPDEKRLYIVDESSLADSQRIERFFARVNPGDRILLVGDKTQHQAVEAGAPFEQFQRRGIAVVELSQIVRQRDEQYREEIDLIASGQIKEAVESLDARGQVIEVANDEKRIEAMAKAFVESQLEKSETLVISPANEERVQLNTLIHSELQARGRVAPEDFPMKVLVNRQEMSGAERGFAGAYHPRDVTEGDSGDVIRYSKGSEKYEVKKGAYARVVASDFEKNTITVRFADKRELTYDPRRLQGVTVYREEARDFSVSDRIQFTAALEQPDGRGKQAVNRDLGIIRKIEEGKFQVEMQGGKTVEIDPARFRHIDHGYAITSHSSQGTTVDRVIVNADTRENLDLLNRRMAYVAMSRARDGGVIYTNSKDELIQAMERRSDKAMALEAEKAAAARSAYAEEMKQREDARRERGVARETNAQEIRGQETPAGNEKRMPPAAIEAERNQATESRKATRTPRTFTRTVMQQQPMIATFSAAPPAKLVRVSRRDPCPVCEKTTWCSTSADKAITICMRTSSEREAKNGGYIHVLDDTARERARPVTLAVEVTQHVRADIAERHEINKELLGALNLNDRDRKELLRRGLDQALVGSKGYKSVPLPSETKEVVERLKDRDLRGVPGFYRDEGRWRLNIGEWKDKQGETHSFHQGFLVPVRDVEGRIEGFQIRRAEVKADEPRYIWLSSNNKQDGASSGAPAHFANIEHARESGQVIITEGALKGDIASHLLGGRAVVAVAGVQSFPEDFGKRLKAELPELRQAVIAFDADIARKPEVQKAMERLTESLQAGGLDVRTLQWDERQGKGIDDYLTKEAGRREEVREYLRESLSSLDHEQSQAGGQRQERALRGQHVADLGQLI